MKLIFDFDGTLADTIDIAFAVTCDVQRVMKLNPLNREQFQNLTSEEQFSITGLKSQQLPEYIDLVRKGMHAQFTDVKLFADWYTLIPQLAKTHELIIATSNSEENVMLVMEDFISHFTQIIADIPFFEKADVLTNFTDAIYFGDEQRDVVACQKAQLPIIAVTWGLHKRALLTKDNPEYLIDSIDEIEPILKSLI